MLFHLEGLSYEQAAQLIHCPVRTVQSRLARGRERLLERLARRGASPTAALISAALAPDLASAALNGAWRRAIVKAAVRYAAGATSAPVPETVAALAKGALQAMMPDKLKSAVAAAMLLGVVASGLGALARSDTPAPVVAEYRHVLRMANGTKIEVVGVSSHPSGPDTWWRPDGTPHEKPPADPAKVDVADGDTKLRAILIRVVDLPEGAVFKRRPTGGRSWGDEPKKAQTQH